MPRRGRQASRDDTADIMHKFATALLSHNNGNNNGQAKSRGGSKSRGHSRGTSATPHSSGASAQPRTPRSKSRPTSGYIRPVHNKPYGPAVKPKTLPKEPNHQAAFAFLQTPVPHLTAKKIADVREVLSDYSVCTMPVMKHDYGYAFQGCTDEPRAPQTIIAQSMKKTDARREVENKETGAITYVASTKYALSSPNDSFLLYVGNEGEATGLKSLWSAEASTAADAFKREKNTYNMYYSFAFMANQQKDGQTTNHDTPIFCTLLIPCVLENIPDATMNLTLKDSLGFVQPDQFPKPPDALTYSTFIDTYQSYILATNFTRDCKLTDASWTEIRTRLASIVGTFHVTRKSQSFGPMQVVQSEKLKIGKRVGVVTDKRTLTLQMVFPTYGMQSGNSPGNSINVMHACFHGIMVKIKAKLDDNKYQEIMKKGGWTAGKVQKLVAGLLDTYNTCLFSAGMTLPVTAERADFMMNGMVNWKQTFIDAGFLPTQAQWDAVPRTPENPLARIRAQVHDDSSDDEGGEVTTETPPELYRARSQKPPALANTLLDLHQAAHYTADACAPAPRDW